MNICDEIKRARRVGTPLIGLTTADQPTTVITLRKGFESVPLLLYDLVRGFNSLGEEGSKALASMRWNQDSAKDPVSCIEMLARAPEKTIAIIENAHRFFDDPSFVQVLMNMRDLFKASARTIVLLAPDIRLPAEITQDVLIIDEPLPDDEAIGAILSGLYEPNGITLEPELLERSKDALRGLAAFPVEQAAALSVRSDKNGARVEIADLWERKRRMIRQVRGLSMEPPRETFADIGGLEQWKKFATALFTGKRKPRLVCWLDEIEKAVAGASDRGAGDSSGTSQDQLGTLLTEMEERELPGALFLGPGGSGKSLAAKATAATFDVPLIRVDLGAAKGSLVGQSEAQIRALMKAIVAAAGEGGALFIATCNGLDNLTAALRRRLARRGMWFFDLPDEAERVAIAKLQCARFEVEDSNGFFKRANGWSGANIRDCCEQADALGMSIEDASAFVVKAEKQDAGIDKLRTLAMQSEFLSASYPGPYKAPESLMQEAQPTIRRIAMVADVEEPINPAKAERGKGN